MAGSKILPIALLACLASTAWSQETSSSSPPKPQEPIIKSLNIHSKIKYTYSTTLVTSKILNPADKAQEVTFKVVLPEEAFITSLIMTIKGKSYDAYVKGKEEAKKDYDAAVSAGQGAAHVFQEDTRNSKDFTVAVNVESQEKVSFNLTYEELLSRKNRTYKNEINVKPYQIVPNLSVIVDIEDALNITNVQVPEFRMNNEIQETERENTAAKKTYEAPNKVRVEWSPSVEEQRQLSKDGLHGQMIVKYDVDASNQPQQILLDTDGYFAHILRNDDLPVLNKHVCFVLDVSGSMSGSKLNQLKDAMSKILSDLSEADRFSIVLFSVKVIAWGPNEKANLEQLNGYDDSEPANVIAKDDFVIPASKSNVQEALAFIKSLDTYGGTNIMGGMRNGLKLAKLGKKLQATDAPQESMIIFLTDGQPNSEESDPDKIAANVERENIGSTIFCLGFGGDADMGFMKKLSLGNGGFARRIYEDADASLQLQNFYKEVASPVLSDVKFEYLPDQVENATSDNFKNLFAGSDNLVLGKVKPQGKLAGALVANSKAGVQRFEIPIDHIIRLPPIEVENKTFGYLEKMWAYKTIKTLLDKNTISKNESLENKAKELALKFSFVTPLTSLVVVKPNESAIVDDNEKSGRPNYFGLQSGYMTKSLSAFPATPFQYSLHSMRGMRAYAKAGFRRTSSNRLSGPPGALAPVSFGAGGGGGGGYMPPPPMFSMPAYSMSSKYPAMKPAPVMEDIPVPNQLSYLNVTWLNQTGSEDGLFLQTLNDIVDVVALNETNTDAQKCANTNPCRHFIFCVLDEFVVDVAKFIPYQCHIPPKFLGVCCPF